ncbi:hypothetical protein [Terriglobus aquaticus]|uniref:Uncharacterized protein n=1 Tax=Terriglobus aquaticus TaxID=940139 RepID=A0ABW9KI31_9BACT|nr:hypothetical protein [Terriglobus aquaticus]
MRRLRDVLGARSYHLGEAVAAQETQPSQEQLIADLKTVITNNEMYFRLCIGALVAVFAGCCFLIYVYRANTLAITGLFTATGISFAAIAPQMLSFWREKVRTDTVLVMARQLPASETMQLIQLLLASGK